MSIRSAILFLALAGFSASFAEDIDRTCKSCSRGYLDTLNYTSVRPVRVNQVGYRTPENQKIAFAAYPTATAPSTTFSVVDTTGKVAWTGPLVSLGKFDGLKARMLIRAYNKSISRGYTLMDTAQANPEYMWKADFGGLTTPGTYRVVVGKDSSHVFQIRPAIYNDVFEASLKFFGAQRCGKTDSWFHKDCHAKDGAALGEEGALQGGWHDCGDHGKYAETEGYAASMLALAYSALTDRAEDRYGASYAQFGKGNTDGIPDLLWEAKVGADYIYRLYSLSKKNGLVAKGDMYHSVGMGPGMDHLFWDVPEKQEAQVLTKGGNPRPVKAGIGGNVAGMFTVSLALVGKAWKPIDPVYGQQLIDAAIDIYDKIVIPKRFTKTSEPCCYDGLGQVQDDPAFAAVALWYVTGQSRFGYDLYQNTAYGNNPGSVFSIGEFAAGLLGNGPIVPDSTGATTRQPTPGYFDHGGWTTDFQQTNQLALYAFGKFILKDVATAAKFGIGADLRDSLMLDVMEGLRRGVFIGSNGSDKLSFRGINVDQPYHGVFTSAGWGFNRYNMGMVTELFLYWDLASRTRFWESMKGKTVPIRLQRPEVKSYVDAWTESVDSMYYKIGLDNLNYQLGLNPWDLSFVMGAGSKNLQHPHNRAANPDGYNAGGIPYDYKTPVGALMGGCRPGLVLKDYWEDYAVTETCIDFSAQLVIPTLMLSLPRPPDTLGPVFENVTVVQVDDSSALIAWNTDELSTDSLYYSLTPGGKVVGVAVSKLDLNKSATLLKLDPKTTYYFWFTGTDIQGNVSRDDNRGRFYTFTTTDRKVVPQITDLRVCNIRSDRATVFWWTDIPSNSVVEFAEEGQAFATAKKIVAVDDEGLPGRFHKVTLKGLKPGTTYRYDAISGSAREDSAGLHHRFTTTKDFADYRVMMKATTKNYTTSGKGAHFYLMVANNESRPYVGLELRFYFTADAATAQSIEVHSSDNGIFGGDGQMKGSTQKPVFGKAQPYGTDGTTWYIPITLLDTLPVSGAMRIEMKIDNPNWEPIPFSTFTNGWSFRPHTAPPDPKAFAGIDMTKPWPSAELFEPIGNGMEVMSFVDNPYVTAHYQGEHIYGYPPDGLKPRVFRNTSFDFSRPLPSPATSVKQDTLPAHLGGRTWSFPDVVAAQWQVDGPAVRPSVPLAGRTDSVLFAHDTLDDQGTNAHEFAFWGDRDSTYCSCAWQRYTVVVDTMKIPPRPMRLVFDPAGPLAGYRGGQRLAVVVRLIDSAGGVFDTTATVKLALTGTLAKAYASATSTTPVVSVSMVGGVARIWFDEPNSPLPGDTVAVEATADVAYAVVKPGELELRFLPPPPWPLLDSAWTADPLCTGKPTEVRLRLSSRLDANLSILSAVATLDGVDHPVVAGAIQVLADSSTLSIAVPDAWIATSASLGTARLNLHVGGAGRDTTVSLTAVVRDRVGPRPLSAAVTERFAPGPDTVLVEFSEPVTASKTWPFAVAGGAAPNATESVVNASPALVRWVVSGSTLGAGSVLSVAVPGAVVDASANPMVSCGPAIAVAVRPSPLPMVSAVVSDLADVGQASRVVVRFARAVRDADLPDSLVLLWGGRNVSIPVTNLVRSADSLELVADLVPPLSEGAGSLPDGSGQVVFRKGSGASGRSDTIFALDRVGPALRSALLKEGPQFDTLVLKTSEGIRPGAAAAAELLRRSGLPLSAATWRIAGADSSRWTLIVPTGSVLAGDSLRLSSVWSDRAVPANPAAANAPWVGLQVADRPPRDAWARDANGDGRVDQVVLRFARALACPGSLKLRWPDSAGFLQEKPVPAGDPRVAVSADGTLWTVDLSGDPFAFGRTGLSAGQELSLGSFQLGTCQEADAPWEAFAVRDSVAPAVASAELRFADPGQLLDTLHVVFTEAVRFAAGNPSVLHVVGALPERGVVQLAVDRQSPDGREAWLLFDPANPILTAFLRGDSVRAAPAAEGTLADLLGNGAADPGHWVPLRFGVRQPRFSLELYPQPILEWKGWELPHGATPLTILVRTHGASTWRTLDGAPVPDPTRLVGPLATVNGPVKGMAKLFDNMGTFVAAADLGGVYEQVLDGRIPTDAAGQYDVWLAWDGRASTGKFAASGVYTMRLVLMRDLAPEGQSPQWMVLNRLFKMGWIVK